MHGNGIRIAELTVCIDTAAAEINGYTENHVSGEERTPGFVDGTGNIIAIMYITCAYMLQLFGIQRCAPHILRDVRQIPVRMTRECFLFVRL